MSEFWERVLEAVGMMLLKVAFTALTKTRMPPEPPPRVVLVEIPTAIQDGEGGTLEVHWVGATKIAPATHPEEERTQTP